MELIKQLEKFGLNQKQAQVYLACLELGTSSVQKISQLTEIKRTTIYDLLEYLINQGLISRTIKGKKKLFIAENPEVMKETLKRKEQEFDQMLPELKSLHTTTGVKPKIKYFEGVQGIKSVLEDTLTSNEKLLRSILPMRDFLELVGEEYFDDYTLRRIKLGYSLRNIRPESKEVVKTVEKYKWGTNKEQRREVRFAPKNFHFSMAMYLYDNKVALLSSKKENFGMIIESKEFTYNQLALFKVLWNSSSPF